MEKEMDLEKNIIFREINLWREIFKRKKKCGIIYDYHPNKSLKLEGSIVNGKKWNVIGYDINGKIKYQLKGGNGYVNFKEENNKVLDVWKDRTHKQILPLHENHPDPATDRGTTWKNWIPWNFTNRTRYKCRKTWKKTTCENQEDKEEETQRKSRRNE